MNGPFSATLMLRRLVLLERDTPRLSLALDQGGRHRLVVADADCAEAVVAALETCPGVGVLAEDGGLLGAMTVAENFTLALRYDSVADDSSDWEAELNAALRLCGLTPQRVATLGAERPMSLERTERWTLGLVRCLLRPPELLVIDRAFAGLARRQANALIAVEGVFHRRYPFRPVLFVDLDSHELPALPECQTLTELAETAENP